MEKGDIASRFGQIVTKYVVRSGIRDDVETLNAARLAHKLGLSTDSVSEVRKTMNGTGGKPSTTKMAQYFKVLNVSDEDQNYVHGIGLPPAMNFSELVKTIQASDDFGLGEANEPKDIRDKKIRARIARNSGELDKADALAAEIEEIQRQTHSYARKDMEQSAKDLAKTVAFRGSAALEAQDFKTAFGFYSQIPKIQGLSKDAANKFANPIRISYNTQIAAQQNFADARTVLDEMKKYDVTPDVVSYTTLLTFLKTEGEVRTVFDEMKKNDVTPNVISYTVLATKCENVEQAKVVAAEFKEAFPNIASPKLSSAVISLASRFEEALETAAHLHAKGHFVGRAEYEKVFSFSVVHLPAARLLEDYFNSELRFDTSLESPINQYRSAGQPEEALQLLPVAPYVGAAQKFYRQEIDLCASYFEAELAAGNDDDNIHYAYGIAACLNADWVPASRHLNIALERCFPEANRRRSNILTWIEKVPSSPDTTS